MEAGTFGLTPMASDGLGIQRRDEEGLLLAWMGHAVGNREHVLLAVHGGEEEPLDLERPPSHAGTEEDADLLALDFRKVRRGIPVRIFGPRQETVSVGLAPKNTSIATHRISF